MGSTKISYLNEVFNPITGCSGTNCKCRDRCFARAMVKRFPWIHGYWPGEPKSTVAFSQVQFHPDRLDKPLDWKRPRRVGVVFMGDWMDDQVQCGWIDQILEVIAACPRHQFFSLTKQPQNLEKKIYGHCPESLARELGGGDYLPNLWNGVSITDQEDLFRAQEAGFFEVPGNKWISWEPAIGAVTGDGILWDHNGKPKIGFWVMGCESGPKRRQCDSDWFVEEARKARQVGIKVYIKQLSVNGKVLHDIRQFSTELQIRELP